MRSRPCGPATPTSTSRPAWAPRCRPSHELAESTGSLYAGKDGKTGETLMKTVLAPMFALRNLKVMSWVGHNIFGNRDGLVLDDPANKSSKVDTKDRVVTQILGYKPSTLVTIEYLPDMGDWKTAWDHIHFQGFLGTKMTLQFTWQGCDSLLAAPLAIDLARLADLEKRRGGRGLDATTSPASSRAPRASRRTTSSSNSSSWPRHCHVVISHPSRRRATRQSRPN